MSNIARRKFLQLSAVAVAGGIALPGREARAEDLPHITEDEDAAVNLKYTHDASSVDPAARLRQDAVQNCANCMFIQGEEGAAWRPCQLIPGKAVAAAGWCSAWAPKP